MTHPAETASAQKSGRHPGYRLCLLLAAAAVVSVLLLRMATSELPVHALAAESPHSVETTSNVEAEPSWVAMSQAHRQVLRPLKTIWQTMSPAQHQRWQLIADRISDKTPEAKQRLHDRMVAWARLTPAERAQARLNYLQAKNHPGRAKADRPRPDRGVLPEHLAHGLETQRSLPPAMVHVAPGATTVLLTTTFHIPTDEARAPTGATPNGPEVGPPDAIKTPVPS